MGIHQQEASVCVGCINSIGSLFYEFPVLRLVLMQLTFGLLASMALLRLADGAFHRGRQADQVTLDDVGGCAVLECCNGMDLTKRARHKDERDMRMRLPRDRKRLHAVKLRH